MLRLKLPVTRCLVPLECLIFIQRLRDSHSHLDLTLRVVRRTAALRLKAAMLLLLSVRNAAPVCELAADQLIGSLIEDTPKPAGLVTGTLNANIE